jgi:glycosyltransferase involved in cell wall biosynthesis
MNNISFPTLAVIIPTFNSERTINATIVSVLRQTYKPQEIIIVDNGSNDRTIEIVRLLEKKSPVRIEIFRQNIEGAGPARNLGVHKSNSEVIAFLDSDDTWTHDKIEKQLHFHSNQENIISGTYAIYLNKYQKRVRSSTNYKSNFEFGLDVYRKQELPFLLSSWMISRDNFLLVGDFDVKFKYAQDFEFFFRALHKGIRPFLLPESLLTYSISSQSASSRNYAQQSLSAMYVRRNQSDFELSLEDFVNRENFKFSNYRDNMSGLMTKRAMVESGNKFQFLTLFWLLGSIIISPKIFIKKFYRHYKTIL